MTPELCTLLLDKRASELNGKSVESRLNPSERAELRALNAHQDKAPAVAQRIRVLAVNLAQPNALGLLLLRFSRKFRQNLAELDALIQFGQSRAVWEIAYLSRRRATQKLTAAEESELHFLTLFNDSPEVLHITQLKLKGEAGTLSTEERQELSNLQRNPYRQNGIPHQLLDLFWPNQSTPLSLDWNTSS